SLALDGARGLTVSMWVRPDDGVTEGTLYQQDGVRLDLAGGTLVLRTPAGEVIGGGVGTGAWHHVAVSVGGGKVVFYVDGDQVAAGEAQLPLLQAPVRIGEGFAGLLDELQISNTVRSGDWVKLAVAAQGPEGRLLRVVEDAGEAADEGGH